MTPQEAIYDFIRRAENFAQIMANAGAPVKFHEFYRGEQDQNQAYARGASKARFGESAHNFAMGADYHFDRYGWAVPDQWWEFGDEVAKMVGLKSGLSFGDGNHLELPGWKSWKPYFLV